MHKTREVLLRHSRQTALAAAREPSTKARTALLELAVLQLTVADEHWPDSPDAASNDPDPFEPVTNGKAAAATA